MTWPQTAYYDFISSAISPVGLCSVKDYMKVTSNDDDDLIQSMIDAATSWGESFTGRDFRKKTYDLKIDCFTDRILIKRDPVNAITSINHLVSDVETVVNSSIYYLKKNTQNSEILLLSGESWPTNTDDREQAITIRFVTEKYRRQAEIENAVQQHVSEWYSNRDDCGDDGCECSASSSGVSSIYGQFRITRV